MKKQMPSLRTSAYTIEERVMLTDPTHKHTGTVTLATAAGRLAVTDTGPGIAAEEIPHAFERFFLYRRYNGHRQVGTGLGLAIVRELAQAMGGDVEVESPPGAGTAFTIRLPLPEAEIRPPVGMT